MMNTSTLRQWAQRLQGEHPLYKWLFDIRIWILVLFAMRLDNIGMGPLDEHSMRQTLTLSVARNMLEVKWDFLRAYVDFGNWDPRPLAAEPPIFNSLIALMYLVFGEHDWFGRLINLTVSSIGLWFLYRFLRDIWRDPRAAMLSTVFFAVSLAFVYSRKSMPDTFALSFVLIGNYYGLRWLQSGSRRAAVAFVLTLAIGLLGKLPMVCVATLLLIPLLQPELPMRRKRQLIGLGAIPVGLSSLWYFVWVPYLIKYENGYQLFESFGLKEGWHQFFELRKDLWEVIFVDGQMVSWLSLGMTLVGIFYFGHQRQYATVAALVLYTLVFTLAVIHEGYVFPTHDYHGIPYNVPLAMMAGYGLAHLFRTVPWAAFLYVVAAAYDAITFQRRDFFIHPDGRRWQHLEQVADSFSQRTDRFSTNSGVDTRLFYYLHRKGIGHFSWDLKDYPEWTKDDIARGNVKFMFIDKRDMQDSMPYPVIFDNGEFRAYKLTDK